MSLSFLLSPVSDDSSQDTLPIILGVAIPVVALLLIAIVVVAIILIRKRLQFYDFPGKVQLSAWVSVVVYSVGVATISYSSQVFF